jgi:hypothetical protein
LFQLAIDEIRVSNDRGKNIASEASLAASSVFKGNKADFGPANVKIKLGFSVFSFSGFVTPAFASAVQKGRF